MMTVMFASLKTIFSAVSTYNTKYVVIYIIGLSSALVNIDEDGEGAQTDSLKVKFYLMPSRVLYYDITYTIILL